MCTYVCNLLRMATSSSGAAIAKTERKHEANLTPNVSKPKTLQQMFISLWFLTNDFDLPWQNPLISDLHAMSLVCPFFGQGFGGCWFCFCKKSKWTGEENPHFLEGLFAAGRLPMFFLAAAFATFFNSSFLQKDSSSAFKVCFKLDSLARNKPTPSDANLSAGSLEVEVHGCSESTNASGTCLDGPKKINADWHLSLFFLNTNASLLKNVLQKQ